ncbi:MAG TPA: cupin domain-containing protein [Gaiellaceae bacterium]
MQRHLRRALSGLAVLLVGAAAGSYATASTRATPPAVVRIPLAAVDNPSGGKGRTLSLFKVTIPAKAQLALHYHPGTQIAYIASGELRYSVKTGSVTVKSGPADSLAKLVRTIASGQTGLIEAGDWIVEQPSTRHSASNPGDKPTVIYLATLFPIGSAPAIPVK